MLPSAQLVPVFVSVKQREELRCYPRCTFRGFFAPDVLRNVKHIWTGDEASVDCCFGNTTRIKYVWLEIGNTAPHGSTIDVLINNDVVLRQKQVKGQLTLRTKLPIARSFDTLSLSIRSTTFVPRDTIAGSQDGRSLGIAVKAIVFEKRTSLFRLSPRDTERINERLKHLLQNWRKRRAA